MLVVNLYLLSYNKSALKMTLKTTSKSKTPGTDFEKYLTDHGMCRICEIFENSLRNSGDHFRQYARFVKITEFSGATPFAELEINVISLIQTRSNRRN